MRGAPPVVSGSLCKLITTPGAKLVKAKLLRRPPLMNNGSCWMALFSTMVPRSLRSVCSNGVVASTCTVSCTAPNCMRMSRRDVVFTCTWTLEASARRKPSFSAVTEYRPAMSERKVYPPSAFVSTVCFWPLAGFSSVTFAVGTIAPDTSVTAPVIVPRSCPKRAGVRLNNVKTTKFRRFTADSSNSLSLVQNIRSDRLCQ